MTSSTQTTANSILKINEQIPEIKVKDYFTSLINQYNLIIVPKSSTEFYIDTLDNWYSKGKAYDISSLVDMKDVTINRPKVKKRIDFLYQKSDTILAKQYFDNNQLSYGDLKATYNITGDELKIETQFENMLFERLTDVSTSTQTDLQCGFAVDINNNPIKGKPIRFYRNGLESDHVHIDHVDHAGVWHTSTEDNIIFEQVTSSMNFGADNSSYFYSPIVTGLYYNFWKTYIEDLYNKKTRVLNLKCKLPIRILYNLGLNDRFVIGDYKYKISSIKTDLTNGDSTIEIYTDLSAPIDSVNNVNPLTIDSTEYTIDSDIITIDAISTYDPVTSYTLNGVSLTTYDATKGEENFEVKISANTNWSISSSDSWITPNKLTGNKSDYLRVKVSTNSGSARTGTLTITIGTSTTFTITINQA
jgi:DNA-binding MltR family transcriptional regulator